MENLNDPIAHLELVLRMRKCLANLIYLKKKDPEGTDKVTQEQVKGEMEWYVQFRERFIDLRM